MAIHRQRSRSITSNILHERRKAKQASGKQLELDEDIVLKLRRWIIGIAVVEFDLDDGPMLAGTYPPIAFSPVEEENIAFSAFPDSLQFDQGSQVHSIRIRKDQSSSDNLTTLDGFIYGFSHFTQRRDPTSKRGYQQSSVVILTQHQYPALFSSLTSVLGPLFQSHGLPMLENPGHCYTISSTTAIAV
ncbi:hypothetical protein H1R20_g2415, partial [Candolleomyces eurysporus]